MAYKVKHILLLVTYNLSVNLPLIHPLLRPSRPHLPCITSDATLQVLMEGPGHLHFSIQV